LTGVEHSNRRPNTPASGFAVSTSVMPTGVECGGDRALRLQGLLDRLQRGDDAARQELIASTYERLRLVARKIFHENFPRLDNLHDTDSVLHEAIIRLLQAFQTVQLPTLRDFFTFAAAQMRRVLIDKARQYDRHKKEWHANGALPGSSRDHLQVYEP